jgi:uncharacterized protein
MKCIDGHFYLAATDLSNHLSCEHLAQLERKVALGDIQKPNYRDPSLDVLIQRGRDHEAAYVNHLSKDKKVVDLRGQSQLATLEAMKVGVDVIVQATFEDGDWNGISDILIKVEKERGRTKCKTPSWRKTQRLLQYFNCVCTLTYLQNCKALNQIKCM